MVTTSGRPAYFLSGGEMPIPVPQSLGTISIQFRKFGTQVDFVPIVLGSGRIHLEVRPKISEIDPTVSITLNGSTIPGFRTRECDTGVEMNAGQTMALAGLLQTDVNQQVQGIPYLMDIPYLGLAFRRSTRNAGRNGTADYGSPGTGRSDELRTSAAGRAGHGHHVARRLRLLLEGIQRSAVTAAAAGGPATYGPEAMGPGMMGPGRRDRADGSGNDGSGQWDAGRGGPRVDGRTAQRSRQTTPPD